MKFNLSSARLYKWQLRFLLCSMAAVGISTFPTVMQSVAASESAVPIIYSGSVDMENEKSLSLSSQSAPVIDANRFSAVERQSLASVGGTFLDDGGVLIPDARTASLVFQLISSPLLEDELILMTLPDTVSLTSDTFLAEQSCPGYFSIVPELNIQAASDCLLNNDSSAELLLDLVEFVGNSGVSFDDTGKPGTSDAAGSNAMSDRG